MRRLTVLYDAECALCRRARGWLERQPKFVELEFVAAGGDEARQLFPSLDAGETLAELNVVADTGAVYRGAKAWVMCLWSLREYRSTALALRSPGTWWAAQRLVEKVSKHRRRLVPSGVET